MIEYLKALINKDKSEKVSAFLALISGLSLILSLLIIIAATAYCGDDKYNTVLFLLVSGIIGLCNFKDQ